MQVAGQPHGDAGVAGGAGDGHGGRALEQLVRVEDVVDLLVLQQAVRVDARLGDIDS